MDAWFEVEWRESGRNGRWEAEVTPRPEWLRSPLHYRNGVSEGGRLSLMAHHSVELEMVTVNGVSVIVDKYGNHPVYRWWRGRVDRIQNDDLLGLSFRSHAPVFLPDVDGCRVELDLAWSAEDRAEVYGAEDGRTAAELGLPRAAELSAWMVGADRVRMRWANPYAECRDWPTRRWLAWEVELQSDNQLHSERMLWCDAIGRGATCRHEIALPGVLPYADDGNGMSVARDGWGVLAYRVRLAELGKFGAWSDWRYVNGP